MRDGNKGGAVGGPLSGHTNGSRDVGAGLDVFAGFGRNSQVDGRVRPCSIALTVEILNQGGESVQFGRSSVPTHEDFPWVRLEVQVQHLLLVLHVHFDLVCRLGVPDSERAANFHLGAILRSGSQQSSDNTFLISVAAERVVEDREKGLQRKSAIHRTVIQSRGVVPEAG